MSKQYGIFILGAGGMQLPPLRTAGEQGWFTAAADGDPRAPGRSLADVFYHIDLKDKQALAQTALALTREGKIHGIFTAGTDFSSEVAWVADACGLPSIGYETALNARYKHRMRAVFREHNVPSPAFTSFNENTPRNFTPPAFGFPVVVKPVDNMGGRGTIRIDRAGDLASAIKTAMGFSHSGTVIVEQFIAGPEFSVDAIIENGHIQVCGIADRHIYFPPFFIEMGHTIPSKFPADVLDEVVRVFTLGIRALGITNGAAKGDIKYTSDGAVVGEIAARLSGGYMSGWTYPLASGRNPALYAMRIAMGLRAGMEPGERTDYSAERAFMSIPGRIARIEGLDEARNSPGVKELFTRVKLSDEVIFPRNNVQKCGNIISRGETYEAAASFAEQAVSKIILKLETPNPATDSFLRGTDGNPHSAFILECAENITALQNMEPDAGSTGGGRLLTLQAFPGLADESCTDWSGRGLKQTVDCLVERYDLQIVRREAHLSRNFYQSVLKGGLQAGMYHIDNGNRSL